MPRPIPIDYDRYDALTVTDDGAVTWLAATPLPDQPGFSGTLVPYFVLSDRGTFFTPGSFNKTAKDRLKAAPHLYQHDTDEPIGKHTEADAQDPNGFRITVAVNQETQRGAELMSNLRFGTPMGLSVGFDTMADRSGTEEDDKVLNRKAAPDFFKNVPVNELRAITAARWWESSSVTFAGIGTAKPDVIHSASLDALAVLLTALTDGTATPDQLAAVEKLVAAHQALAAPGTDELAARRRTNDIAAAIARARYAGLLAQGYA